MPRWPEWECLHEHSGGEDVILGWPDEVVKVIPAVCPECGKAWPEQVYVYEDGKCARCNIRMVILRDNPLLETKKFHA